MDCSPSSTSSSFSSSSFSASLRPSLLSFVGVPSSAVAASFASRIHFSSSSSSSSRARPRRTARHESSCLDSVVRRARSWRGRANTASCMSISMSWAFANLVAPLSPRLSAASEQTSHTSYLASFAESQGQEPAGTDEAAAAVAIGTSIYVAHGLFDTTDIAARDASWLAEEMVPDLHAAGLLGTGQVVGLGDTGVNVNSCAFADEREKAPINGRSATHRKIVSYFTLNGDATDGLSGHGTHVAGCIAANASAELGLVGRGLAPGAKLAIVDVEKSSKMGVYNVPHQHIGPQYFDLFRGAGASAVCSPWGFSSHAKLEAAVDTYAYQHQDFLPVFPSGNTFDSKSKAPVSPCGAKNVLCVGASYNARRSYLAKPSFVNAALRLANGEELPIVPAAFGATAPLDAKECEATVEVCLASQAACPACAFDTAALSSVSEAATEQASPSDGCSTLTGFTKGRVCLVYRGDCNFETKARHCSEAGASGVLVINTAGSQNIVMVSTSPGVASSLERLPIALISQSDASKLLFVAANAGGGSDVTVTFPVVSKALSQMERAPYSSYGKVSGNKYRPELLFPGDNILSTDAHSSCGLVVLSGTSQSCGIAVGSIALVREYLQTRANPHTARLGRPAAATLRALLAASARTPEVGVVLEQDKGYGLPHLAGVLNMTDTARLADFAALHIVESEAYRGKSQQFCFTLRKPEEALQPPSVALAWTDLPDAEGRLVNDLNLKVDCIKSAWSRWGNSNANLYGAESLRGAMADAVSTIEKVSLSGPFSGNHLNELCVVTIDFVEGQTATSTQKFSLVMTGPFALTPGCELGLPASPNSQDSPPASSLSDVQKWQLCGETGTATIVESDGTTAWRCSCRAGWYGPLCTLRETSVPAGEKSETTLGAWQWDLKSLPLCGPGSYRFELSSEAPLDDLAVLASGDPQSSGLFPTTEAAASTAHGQGARRAWREGGLDFVLERASKSLSLTLTKSYSGSASEVLYLSSFNLRHGGALTCSLQWTEAPSACQLPGTSLRGSAGGSSFRVAIGFALVCCSICTAAFAFFMGLKLRRRRGPSSGYRHKTVDSVASSPDEGPMDGPPTTSSFFASSSTSFPPPNNLPRASVVGSGSKWSSV